MCPDTRARSVPVTPPPRKHFDLNEQKQAEHLSPGELGIVWTGYKLCVWIPLEFLLLLVCGRKFPSAADSGRFLSHFRCLELQENYRLHFCSSLGIRALE